MAERVVKVTLRAQIAEYKKGMLEAAASTRTVGTEAEKLAQKKQAFQQVGAAGLAMGVTIGAGLTMAVAKFADFDQAMSNVAATGQDARDNIDALRQAAIDAGAATVFSADESANAIEEMAKAGVDAKDILAGGLSGALDLAAAGGLGVADAAGIAATALKVFNLEGSDMSHVADLLAAGAGKAMGDVTDLSQALAQGGQVAAATGLSIEETTATLAAFASQGLLGSDAGTSFKTMLQRLTPQSAEAKKKMDELGISAYDAAGQFIGMEAFAGNLQSALKDLTPEARNAALSVMFGSDAVRAANVIYQEGADGIAEWTAKVDDAGYAAKTAATRLDNLKGDWEALMGALDSAMIGSGEAANLPLRSLVQGLTGLVDVFNDLPSGGQQATFWIAAIGSAGAVTLGTYLTLVPKMAEFNESLKSLSPSAANFASKMATVAKYAGVVAGVATVMTVGASSLVEWAKEAYGVNDAVAAATTTTVSFTQSMIDVGSVTEASSDRVRAALDNIRSGNVFGDAGNGIFELQDSLSKLGDGLKAMPLDAATAKVRAWGAELGLSDEQMRTFVEQIPGFTSRVRDQLAASGEAADEQAAWNAIMREAPKATQDQQRALEELQGVATDTTQDVNQLADAIRNFGSAQFDTERASIAFGDALADLQENLDGGEASLDLNTDAGRRTADALLDAASKTNDYAGAVAAVGGSTEQVQGILEVGRQKIIDTRIALGDTEEAARAYADRLVSTPQNVRTQVELVGAQAASDALDRMLGRLNAIPSTKNVTVQYGEVGWGVLKDSTAAGNYAGGLYAGGVKAFYSGGFASGIYAGVRGGIHKFAESEMGVPWETYISGRAADRERNIGIWQETGRRLGVESGGAGASVSIEGASISGTLEIGGDGLARIVDGRISLYDREQKQAAARGYDGGF